MENKENIEDFLKYLNEFTKILNSQEPLENEEPEKTNLPVLAFKISNEKDWKILNPQEPSEDVEKTKLFLSNVKLKLNDVYFDKSTKQFCQLRKIFSANGLDALFGSEQDVAYKLKCIFSNGDFYGDAKTTICEVPHSYNYVNKNMVVVNNISDFADFDGNGWHVRK